MNLNQLQDRVEAEILLGGAHIGLYLEDFADGETLAIHADTPFPLASVIKVPIMAHLMEQASAGQLALTDTLELDLSAPAFTQPDGSGVLTYLTSKIALSLRDLCALSIIESDNLATNLLIERLDMGYINDALTRWGLTETRLTHLIQDFPTLRLAGNNPGTARDLGRLFGMIYRRELPYSDLMIDLLCKQIFTARLPYFLPDDDALMVGHKTGTLKTLTHDAGLFIHPRYAYTLSMLVRHNTTTANAALMIARCSELVYRYMVDKHR